MAYCRTHPMTKASPQIIGALLLIIIIFSSSNSHPQEPLRFAKIIETPDQVVGAKILKSIYQRVGIPIEFIEMPGRRALADSSAGTVDGEIHRIFSVGEDYPTLIRVPTPINYIEPTVFSKKADLKIDNCADLKPQRVGIVRGVRHAENCTKGLKNRQVVGNSQLLMKILDKDRVDAVITARINGLLQLRKLNFEGIHALSPPLSREPLYHYLHEKHRDLVPKIDQVIQEMEKDGTLKNLRKRVTEELIENAGP